MEDKIEVRKEEVEAYASEVHIAHTEASAKTGKGVADAFHRLALKGLNQEM